MYVLICTFTSEFIRFARASSNFSGFSQCDKLLTVKLLKQGY